MQIVKNTTILFDSKDTAINQNIQDFTQKKYGTTLAEQRRKAYV